MTYVGALSQQHVHLGAMGSNRGAKPVQIDAQSAIVHLELFNAVIEAVGMAVVHAPKEGQRVGLWLCWLW